MQLLPGLWTKRVLLFLEYTAAATLWRGLESIFIQKAVVDRSRRGFASAQLCRIRDQIFGGLLTWRQELLVDIQLGGF